eukprot:446154-Pleurochrysis_carterae.AAC.1
MLRERRDGARDRAPPELVVALEPLVVTFLAKFVFALVRAGDNVEDSRRVQLLARVLLVRRPRGAVGGGLRVPAHRFLVCHARLRGKGIGSVEKPRKRIWRRRWRIWRRRWA